MTQRRKKTLYFHFFFIFVTFARFGKVNSDAFEAAHLFQFFSVSHFWLFEGFAGLSACSRLWLRLNGLQIDSNEGRIG
jgi:hypothetical protein